MRPFLSTLVALLLVSACASLPYTADLSREQVQPSTLMVAQPLKRRLLVVLDPAKVPDGFKIANSSHAVRGFQPFLRSSLERTLAPFFSKIEFVAPGYVPPDEPHWVVDLKVDGIEATNLVAGGLTYSVLNLQWGFGLRSSEGSEYVYSFAGVGKSELSYATLEEGCQQAMKSALHEFLGRWTEKDVFTRLRAAELASPLKPKSSTQG